MRRVLVANRGEIAVRVIRAAHDLGLEAVAVHSSADASAAHVRLADAAVEIGPPPAQRSYLDIAAVLAAAERSGADAVHPGYGFLSESETFARACEDAGLIFVGPTPDQIALMGDKARAREVARAAGVPTVRGSEGPVTVEDAVRVAADVGYPVALKAAGGGGGRGIRVVAGEEDLLDAFAAASREAQSAFSDSRLYVEQFVRDARHVEVQVLGDGASCIHLFERDCSLQRRRQKVVEEGPAHQLGEATRTGLHAAAVDLCKSVGYRGAGTVEFLVDMRTEAYYFIEANTRIQVEHPVTEMLTGIDLVAQQLRIAGGEPLSLAQSDVALRGAALELRINAEDPDQGFLPSPGPVPAVRFPAGPWVRVDAALDSGGEVTPYYDSLVAKVIVWGEDRETCIARARRALSEVEIDGIRTTAPLLTDLLGQDWFADGAFHTTTLEGWLETRSTR